MKTWTTNIYALDPLDGCYKTFGGPYIQAPSRALAHEFCQNNGLGYCHIDAELIMEIPCKKGTTNIPDWEKKIDYEKIDLN
jgi:hypothetical protein